MRLPASAKTLAAAVLATALLAPTAAATPEQPRPTTQACGAVVHVGKGDPGELTDAYETAGVPTTGITINDGGDNPVEAMASIVQDTETQPPVPGGRCWVLALEGEADTKQVVTDALATIPHDERVLWINSTGDTAASDSIEEYAQTFTSDWDGDDAKFPTFAATALKNATSPTQGTTSAFGYATATTTDAPDTGTKPRPEPTPPAPPAEEAPTAKDREEEQTPANEDTEAPKTTSPAKAEPTQVSTSTPAAEPAPIVAEDITNEATTPAAPAPAPDTPADTTGFNMDRASGGGAVKASDWNPDEVYAFDIRSTNPSFLTGDYIDTWLKDKYSDSPLIGYGDKIIEMSEETGISAGFALGNWAKETTFGRNKPGSGPHYNFGCMTAPTVTGFESVNIAGRDWASFGTVEVGIEEWFKYVKKGYVDEGKTSYKDFLDKYSPASDNNDHSTFGNIMWGVLSAVGYDLSQKAPTFPPK